MTLVLRVRNINSHGNYQHIRVYIEDHRFDDKSIQSKTVANLTVPGILRDGCVYISTQHFLEQLQSGCAAIHGSGGFSELFHSLASYNLTVS